MTPRALLICTLFASALFAPPSAAVGAAPHPITRVTVHRDATAYDVFRDLADQADLQLDWSAPTFGPRFRFDADDEPFWSAVVRACERFDVHLMTGARDPYRLPIGAGSFDTRVVSDTDAPVVLITQGSPAYIEYLTPGDEGLLEPRLRIRITACFDAVHVGPLAAWSEAPFPVQATDDAGNRINGTRRIFATRGFARSFPPGRMLMQRIDMPLYSPPEGAPPRRMARLSGTMSFIAVNEMKSVTIDLPAVGAAPGAAVPKQLAGATVQVDRIADAPAGRCDVRVRITRGALNDACWQLIRPQFFPHLEVSLLSKSGGKIPRHPATHTEDFAGWDGSDTSLDAVFRFDARRGSGLLADVDPAKVTARMPIDATLFQSSLELTDVDLPELPSSHLVGPGQN